MAENVFNVVRTLRFPETASRRRLGADSLRFFADMLRLVDVVLLFVSGALLYLAYVQPMGGGFRAPFGQNVLLATLFLPFVLEKVGCYTPALLDRPGALCRTVVVGCVIVFGGLLAIGFATNALGELSRMWSLVWFAVSLGGMLAARLVLAGAVARLRAAGHLREAVAIIGAGPWGARLLEYLTQQRSHPVEILGTFDPRLTRATSKFPPPDGTLEDLIALGKQRRIDKIIVALPWSAEHRLLDIIHMFKGLAVDIVLSPDQIGFSLMNRPVDYVGELPTMRVVDRPLSHWRYVAKQIEDKVLAGLALVVLAPVFAIVALAIKLDSPGPVFFRQKRHGFNNTEFEVYKFRSMKWEQRDAAGAQQASRNDSRITKLGAFLRASSIDELPQLINVLKGDMSVVGPRPHPIGMRTANRLCDEIIDEYAHRHRVKPGITGWAQVNGLRGATETAAQLQRRVELDLHYIDNWSIVFDLKIMFLTVIAVLRRENAF